jgi:uncharacterized protein (DUF488 family)
MPAYRTTTNGRCCKNSRLDVSRTLYTLGHGTLSAEAFGALMGDNAFASLVDVRTVPKSARHPQFRADSMSEWIPRDSGASYRWEPSLGGFRKPRPDSVNVALRHPAFRGYADYMESEPFVRALEILLEQASEERTVVVCSESVWWKCHRRLIADAASLLHSFEVQHLMHTGRLQPHVPTQGVRVAGGRLQYDVILV